MRLAFHSGEKPRLQSVQRSASHTRASVQRSVPASQDLRSGRSRRLRLGRLLSALPGSLAVQAKPTWWPTRRLRGR